MVKKLGWICLAGLLSCLIVAMVAMTTLKHISPQMFKSKIHTIVNQKTAQTLIMDGEAHWSLFPWVGFIVHDVAITNHNPDYTLDVSAPKIEVHISPLSLLIGHIGIEAVRLIQPKATMHLHQPSVKYLPLFSAFSLLPKELAAQFDLINSPNLSLDAGFNFDILQGQLTASTDHRRVQLSQFNAHANHIQDTNPYSLSFEGIYRDQTSHQPPQPVHFSTLIHNTPDHYAFNNSHLIIDYTSPNHTKSVWQLNGDVHITHDLSHIQMTHLVASTAEFRAQGQWSIDGDMQHMHGHVSAPPFNCRGVLKNFDIDVDAQDPHRLTHCTGHLDFAPTDIKFRGQIDDVALQGVYHANHAYPNHLHLNTLDLKPLLPSATLVSKPTLHPLQSMFNLFDVIDMDTLRFGALQGHQQHCVKQGTRHHCHMSMFLDGQLDGIIAPNQDNGLGWTIALSGQHITLMPLLALLPNIKGFSTMGTISGTTQIHFMPQASKHQASLTYQGNCQSSAIDSRGFSFQQQFMHPEHHHAFLKLQPSHEEHFQHLSMHFNGVNEAVSIDQMKVKTNSYSTATQGFIDLNSGALSFKMHVQGRMPEIPNAAYRILGTWPNYLRLIKDLSTH